MPKAGWEQRQVHFTCEMCGCDFSIKPSRVRLQRTPVRFCSRVCKDKAQEVTLRDRPFACSACKVVKPPEEFFVDNLNRRGRVARCKSCYAENAANVIRFKPNHRQDAYRSTAKRRGLPYELTRDQFMGFWQKPCMYCGDDIATIGLDRIDNLKGYTMDNLVPCCSTCNSMKSNLTMEEFLNRCQRITSRDCNRVITRGGKY